jgi:hypothetical protein
MWSSSPSEAYLAVQTIDLESYLQDTIKELDPCFQLSVSEKHRKGMMRALLNISKAKMDQELRNLQAELQWQKAESFLKEELCSLTPSVDDAPQYMEGLLIYENFKPAAKKVFSFLARGRKYQGRLERLLEEVKPELVPAFSKVAEKVPELRLLEDYALGKKDDRPQRDCLLRCVRTEFPKSPPDLPEAGKVKGIRSEMNLQKYLEERFENDDTKKLVLNNVYISKKKKSGKVKVPYTIQLPSSIKNWVKMTSELDALVLDSVKDGDTTVSLIEVWEAKTTLNPATIYDALTKKYTAVSKILEISDVQLCQFSGKEQRNLFIAQDKPRFGIYGTKLLSSKAAARQSQVLVCEKIIETSPLAVKEALSTGKISVSHEMVLSDLNATLSLAQEIQPTVIVATYF